LGLDRRAENADFYRTRELSPLRWLHPHHPADRHRVRGRHSSSLGYPSFLAFLRLLLPSSPFPPPLDNRTTQTVSTFWPSNPEKNEHGPVFKRARGIQDGVWVSCLDVSDSDDWLVTGGGDSCLSLYHLRSQQRTTIMPTPGHPQVVKFFEDKIYSAGDEPNVYSWSLSGKLVSRLTSASSRSIFSLDLSPARRLLTLAGDGAELDAFTSYNIRSTPFTS